MSEFIGRELDVTITPCTSEWGVYPKGKDAPVEEDKPLKYVANEDDYTTAPHYSEPYRPLYHFTTQRGWINDPNGCIYVDGKYHLYYQHCPGSIQSMWDNNHWGHAVSTDLFNWVEYEPPLRYPHEASGTGFFNRETGKVMASASHRIYESDDRGYHYHIYGYNKAGSGDPKFFWHEETQRYISITLRDIESYHVASSPDFENWTHESDIENFRECPEMIKYRIEGEDEYKWVLNGGDGAYIIGLFDGHRFIRDEIDLARPDKYVHVMEATRYFTNKYNGYFIDPTQPDTESRYSAYAFQNFDSAPDGRHIRIAWYTVPFHAHGEAFTQAMTIPQELTLRRTPFGLRLCAMPVKEIANYYTEQKSGESVKFDDGEGFDTDAVFTLSADYEDGTPFAQIREYTLSYVADKTGRKYGGGDIMFTTPDGHTFPVPFAPRKNDDGTQTIKVRATFDRLMAEFFLGDGEVYLPLKPRELHCGIEEKPCGNAKAEIKINKIKRSIK